MQMVLIAGLVCAMLTGTVAPKPLVIAHRGASAYLPEHTLPAYALAYGMGSDVIEPDLVLTKDDVLLCSHDINLERTTDVEEKFPAKKRTDGKWYAVDLTYAEIKTLTVNGPSFGGVAVDNKEFTKTSFAEMVTMISRLNSRTGRNVQVIPEPKMAAFHKVNGKDLVARLDEEIRRLQPLKVGVIVQSFEIEAVKEFFAKKTPAKLVFLMSDAKELVAAGGLSAVKEVASGIGPNFAFAAANNAKLIRDAQGLGLEIYPWTFDGRPGPMETFYKIYKVNGLFTDFPDVARRVVDSL